MIDLIGFFLDIISFLIFIGILIWIGIFMIKLIVKRSKHKKYSKELVNSIEIFEEGFKKTCKNILSGLSMVFSMGLATLLAIEIKPIIFKLNYPLGESYATFASYIVAICLYLMLPKWCVKEDRSEQ